MMQAVDKNHMTKLTVEEYSKYFRNKKDLHEHLLRCGFYLPKQKEKVCTEEWLMNVVKGQAWCPLADDIRIKLCPRPPNKDVLLEKFWNFIDFNRHPMPGVDREKHRFDKNWLLHVLSTYVP